MDICTLCKTPIPESAPQEWTLPDGQTLQITSSATASAIANTSLGEFEICESCYQRGLPTFFLPQDLAEIHNQFGLEYYDRGQFQQSIDALAQARSISETADIVAAQANAENGLGNREAAMALYLRALEIDPEHFISRQNLQRMRDNP